MMDHETQERLLKLYFDAWRTQDASLLSEVFSDDAIYRVKPFGIEEYHGIREIEEYWRKKPVSQQVNPNPRLLEVAYGPDLCFAEWENQSTSLQGKHKTTRGILLMKFDKSKVVELREHYLSQEL